jgi:hypothetical protein
MIDTACSSGEFIRDEKWSESVAIGNERYVQEVKEKLGTKVKSRELLEDSAGFSLRESRSAYNDDFSAENADLSLDIHSDILNCA